MSDVREDLAAVRNDLARLADTVSNMVSGQSRAAGANARGAMDQARGRLQSRANDLSRAGTMLAAETRDRLSGANAEVEARIERNPITAVLIAAGVGLVLGMLSRSR